jgi:hypothetical protein
VQLKLLEYLAKNWCNCFKLFSLDADMLKQSQAAVAKPEHSHALVNVLSFWIIFFSALLARPSPFQIDSHNCHGHGFYGNTKKPASSVGILDSKFRIVKLINLV